MAHSVVLSCSQCTVLGAVQSCGSKFLLRMHYYHTPRDKCAWLCGRQKVAVFVSTSSTGLTPRLLTCLLVQLGLVNPALTSQQIKANQATVTEKRTQLQGLRQQRDVLAKSRDAAAAELRKAEAVLRDAHYSRLQQRQQLLEQQAMQVWRGWWWQWWWW